MNINNMQLKTKQEEIITSILKSGANATSYEVSNKLKEFFDKKPLGSPYFNPIDIADHEVSNSLSYNEMFKSIGLDLDILYKSNIDQNNKILIMEEYYESEKNKVKSMIDKLELRMDNLQEILNSFKIAQSFYQIFNTFYNIDFIGDAQRNIPAANCFIDLLQKKVSNYKQSTVLDKYDITKADIVLNDISEIYSFSNNGDIKSILSDSINSFYMHTVVNETVSKSVVSFDITLDKPIVASLIALTLSSSNLVKASLSYSLDGVDYTNLYDIEEYSTFEWNFKLEQLQYFKIILSKNEPDGLINDLYEYYYVLKNLSVTKESYSNVGTFVSKPITFTNAINTLTIIPKDFIFPNTNVVYYIGLDNGIDKVNWENISPNEPLNLNILESKTKIINERDNGFGEQLSSNHLYGICKLPKDTNLNSIEVYFGYQSWYVESMELNQPGYILNENDYLPVKMDKAVIFDCERYDITLQSGDFYMFTQYVYCDEEKNVNSKYIKASIGFDNAHLQSMILVNNIKVKTVNDIRQIHLNKGRNKIQIVMYVSTEIGEGIPFNINHNINFKEATFDIYAFPKMKRISYQDLLYRAKTEDVNAPIHNNNFAITPTNKIAVKNNPSKSTGDNDFNRFLIKYKTFSDSSINKVTNTNGNKTVRFRVMASLLSSEPSLSPQIINYRIIGE